MTYRVLLAGLFHETHTFLEGHTPLSEFQCRTGIELFAARGDGSPLAGVLEVADRHGWDLTPLVDLRATPSATVADEVLDYFWSAFSDTATSRLAAGSVDGIYLVLHGAMVTASIDDVEGTLIERIRRLVGGATVPICGVLDLHGNISRGTIENTDGFVAYRHNPHTDACEAAQRAAEWLHTVMSTGRRPTSVWAQPPIIWPPTGTATADEPLRSLERIARQAELSDPDIAFVNVFAGFSFADVMNTGVSFSVTTTGDPLRAAVVLDQLVAHAVQHRDEGNQVPPSLAAAWGEIRELLNAGRTPVILVEPADNIGGGAPGDTTDILRQFVEQSVSGAVVVINDAEAVDTASHLGVGQTGRLSIGARHSARFCQPLVTDVEVLFLSDGRFDLEDSHSHLASMCGLHIDMGPTAVVRLCQADIRVLLTSRKTPPFDLGQLRSQGIEPERCRVIAVKAAVAHRRAYDPITGSTITVDTAGPCSSDLKRFPYQSVRRPVFPLSLSDASQ